MGTPEVYVASSKAFSEDEQRKLADDLSRVLEVEVGTATISGEALDLQPIVSFVWEKLTDAAFTLLLAKIGSELWKVFQKRARETISKHVGDNSRIEFKFLGLNGTEVWFSTKARDPSTIQQAFEGLRPVLMEIQFLSEGHNLPGTKRIVYCELVEGKQWQITGATEMAPDFAQYEYEGPKWIEHGRISEETIKRIKSSVRNVQ